MRLVRSVNFVAGKVLTWQQHEAVIRRVIVILKLDPPTESGETADVLAAAGREDQI